MPTSLYSDFSVLSFVSIFSAYLYWASIVGEEVENVGTSKSDASKAGKLLQNPKTPKNVKSVAGSDLAQRKGSAKRKGK